MANEVKVVKVRGGVGEDTEQLADVFTKATSRIVHNALIPKIDHGLHFSQVESGCLVPASI